MSENRFSAPVAARYSGTPAATNTPFVTLFAGDNPWLSAFGSAAGACTITVYYSNDGETYYASQNKQVLSGAGPFAIDLTTGAAYVGLATSALVAITAIISAKG